MKIKIVILSLLMTFTIVSLFMASAILIYTTFIKSDSRIVVNQPEYNHIVIIDTCRVVTDTLGKPFCVWYQDKLYLPDPYQESDQQILKNK